MYSHWRDSGGKEREGSPLNSSQAGARQEDGRLLDTWTVALKLQPHQQPTIVINIEASKHHTSPVYHEYNHVAESNHLICVNTLFTMARLSQGTALAGDSSASPDAALTELTQLLLRLQQNLLHPTPERERRLRTSEYERAKVESVG